MAKKAKKYRVVSDNFSNHGLPIGAIVEPCDGPEWSNCNYWYTLGGEDDATAIDNRDLERA